MTVELLSARTSKALPASLVTAIPIIAEATALLDDEHHLIIEAPGKNRYVQFAAFLPNLRGETVGNYYLEADSEATPLTPGEIAWQSAHGWCEPDESNNWWHHWEPADYQAAATAAIVTLHAIHGATDASQLRYLSDDPRIIELIGGGEL